MNEGSSKKFLNLLIAFFDRHRITSPGAVAKAMSSTRRLPASGFARARERTSRCTNSSPLRIYVDPGADDSSAVGLLHATDVALDKSI
jgi:hypothetical protein